MGDVALIAVPGQGVGGRVIGLRVFPNSSCVLIQTDKVQLQVKALLENGNEIDVTASPYTVYSSSNEAVATVTSAGLVSVTGAGKTHIRAEYLLSVGYAEILANPSASISDISPLFGVENYDEMLPEETAPTVIKFISPGEQVQISAMAMLSNGEVCHVTSNSGTVYASSNLQIAGVDSLGRITADNFGTAQINVQAAGISTSAVVHVQLKDERAPITDISFSTPLYVSHSGSVYLSTRTFVYLNPSDPAIEGAYSSGVSFTGISIDELPANFTAFWRYIPFTVMEGPRTLYYVSRDNAGNTEVIKSSVVYVDGTAPEVSGEPKVEGIGLGSDMRIWKNVKQYALSWTNPSDASGVAGARVKFGTAAPASNDAGMFFPAQGLLVYSSTEIVSGQNDVWLWLEDNVGNANPASAVKIVLGYEVDPPISTAGAPAVSTSPVVPVIFVSSDPLSGVSKTVLWSRKEGVVWSSGAYALTGSGGVFQFNTQGAGGNWEFYTQAFDNAGNAEPVPVSTTAAKAAVYVDTTPPAISYVRVTEINGDSARISWETDDETSGVLEYGLSAALGSAVSGTGYSVSRSVLLSGLVYPANYYFRISVLNRTGLGAVYTGGSFYVPPKITTNIDPWGVLNTNQPIVIEVTNPVVSSITYTLGGQTVTQAVSSGTPLAIYAASGQGQTSLSLNLGGFAYTTDFTVDTATRTVHLARFVISAGGLMSSAAAQSIVDMTTGQTAQEMMSNGQSRLYPGYYAGIDPVAPGNISNLSAVSVAGSDRATLTWQAPGDDAHAGTAVKYDLRWATVQIDSSNFMSASRGTDIPFPLLAGTTQEAVVSGLNQLTTYYFSIRTEDELGNISGLSNLASVFKGHVLASTVTVNGKPEISFMSPVPPSITLISTISARGAVAIGSASAAGLTLAGSLYEIGPEGTFDPPAELTFYYSTSTLAARYLLEPDIAVYEHFPESGWVKLPGQVFDTATHKITVPITRIASLFGVFGVVRDLVPPVTELAYSGLRFEAAGKTFINYGSSVSLNAFDPVVSGTSTGVAFTEYRVDPGTSTGFTSYVSPFALPEGFHNLEFRSRDNAGNMEAVKYGEVYVDAAAPVTTLLISGTTGQNGWLVSTATVTLVSTDGLSGLAGIYFHTDGSTVPVNYTGPIAISSEGISSIYYYAEDSVGNREPEKTLRLKLDMSVPEVTAVSTPAANSVGWNNSWVSAVFSGSDTVSGVAYCSQEQAASVEKASQTISGYCIDYAGWSSTRTLTVNIDTTAPSLQHTRIPSVNESGWNGSSVTLKFTCSDALSGILACPADISLEGEGLNISTSAKVFDYADNSQLVFISSVNIDRTLPLSSAALAGTYKNGWYSSPVGITLTSTDSLSGIKEILYSINGEAFSSYQQPVTASADGGSTVKYYSKDKAGNTEAEKAISFSIDRTAPQVGYILNPQPNSYDWNNSSVEAVFKGTDTLSGTEICSSSRTYIEGAGKTLSGWCRDIAGNIGYSTAVVNIDISSPVVTVIANPAANSFNWNNTPVTVAFSGSDDISGVLSCSADIPVPSEGKEQFATGYCEDKAGNTRTAFRAVSIDMTRPATTAGLAGSIVNGWYNTPVSISLDSIDALSGIRQTNYRLERGGVLVSSGVYVSSVAVSADGLYSVYYYGTDKAGNAETEKSTAFKIDRTQPQIGSRLIPPANSNNWNNTAVQVVFNGTDTLSGVAECSSGTVAAEGGEQVLSGWCRDNAGNISYTTAAVNVDLTRPIVTAAQTPAKNNYGWNNTPLAVTFAGTDALSGIAYCTPAKIISTEGSSQTASGYCLDYAGWSSTATVALNIDRTAPAITISSPAAGRVYVATREKVGMYFTVKDNLDPAPKTTAVLTQLEDLGSPRGGRPSSVVVVNGQLIEPLDLDDGLWQLTVGAADFADNISSAAGGVFEVVHDVLPPRAALSAAGGYRAGADLYVTGRTTFTLASVDDLVAVMDGSGLGVKSQSARIASGGAREWAFPNPAPKQGEVFISTFSLDREADGVYGLAYNSEDVLGNVEKIIISTFIVDNTAPQTAFNRVSGPAYLNYVSTWTLFELAPIDPGAFASGVKETAYSINAAVVSTAPLKFTLPAADGGYLIKYRSKDNLENLEVEKSSSVFIDATPPVTSFNISEPLYLKDGARYITPASALTFAAADPLSNEVAAGVERIETAVDSGPWIKYTQALKFAEGRHTIKYRGIDNVGNVEAERSLEVQCDNTAPASKWSVSGGDWIERGSKFYFNSLGRIALASADPLVNNVASGLENIYYGIDAVPAVKYNSAFGLGEGVRVVNYKAIDNVGNTEVVKSTVIYVDGTKPVTELSVSGDQYKNDRQYISRRTDILMAAADPVVNEVSVGVKATKYAVDSGGFSDYSQFKLSSEGKRLVSYYSADYVNNIETVKTAELWVDATAPSSALDITGGSQYSGTEPGIFYASLATEFSFAAWDPVSAGGAAGVKKIEYADNGSALKIYAQPISLGEGKHTITYRSTDLVENIEVFKSTQIYVDNTAPVTAFNISEPLYIKDGVRYITPVSGLAFAAADPLVNEVAAGVERIETAVDSGPWIKYTQALRFIEGRHTIKYRASDNVGNVEAERVLEVQSDATAPVSQWFAPSGDRIEKGGKFYLNALGRIALESADPVVSAVASGVEGIYYGIDAVATNKYSAPFGLAEGIRTVNFTAKDNVNNTEITKSTAIYVDGTKPVTELSLSGDQSHTDKQYISQRTDIVITAADPVVNEVSVGVKETKYTVDGGAFGDYSRFKLNTEGKRVVSFYSIDYVNNTEAVKAAELWVDNTAPATVLSISGVRYSAPGEEKIYLTKDSGIVLTPADPLSNYTASGVMLTKYRVDSGNWQVYLGSFTIAAEGLHTLEYYSLDRVQNAESPKSAIIAVDNTPPSTGISLGEPKSEVIGLPVLMQNTPITLSAADPVMNGVASGLNAIFYELENLQTGALAPVKAYTSPFTIPEQGTYMIRYWAKDNTSNLEIPKEKIAAVSSWRADGLAAVSGLDMSGTADIAGTVKSNAIVSLGGNARILGDVTAGTITISGKAQITGQQAGGATPVAPVPIYTAGIAQSAAEANNNALVSAYLVGGKLVLASHAVITLTTGTYYFKGLELSGGSSITIAGKVDILVEGGVSINGGSSMNASGPATGLSIVVSTTSELKFNGGGSLAACLYAPYSDMKLTGNALLGGHYFVRTAAVSGTGNLIQSGETLPVPAPPTGGGPKTKASAMPTVGPGALAGPDPAFRLGEVYVFPNPAKGSEAPVFHIETGIADSVKITIYTISGRAAHEQILTGLPVELDDGNGLSYAYEYVWRGHIPSGVYLYSIEAQKSGQKLKKTGKFAVVR